MFLALLFIEKKYKTKKPYYIALIIYFIFLSFRYMQGTDYYSYYYAYFFERNIFDAYNYGFVRDFEFLYNLVVSIFRTFNLSFFTFISCMSGLVLALYHRFFKAYKVDSVISVILLYMLYGIVFIESAIRQGIALALLLGISLVGYKKKDIRQVILGALLAFLVHRTSIFFSLVLIFMYFIFEIMKVEEVKVNKLSIIALILMCLVINFFPFEAVFAPFAKTNVLAHKIVYYFSSASLSIVSMGLRCVYMVLFGYIVYSSKINIFKRGNEVYLLYFLGLVFYFMVAKFSILSRITVYFEIFEICIFSYFLISNKFNAIKYMKIFVCVYALLACTLYVKDGIATQQQSVYREVDIICPYHTFLTNR